MTTKISHLSVGVKNPQRAAEAIAALSGGTVKNFVPVPGSFAVLWGGWEGQFVELYPQEVILVRTESGAEFARQPTPPTETSVHLNLVVDLSGEEVKRIAAEYGYPYHFRPQGGGPLHEVWIEGELLLEIVSSELR